MRAQAPKFTERQLLDLDELIEGVMERMEDEPMELCLTALHCIVAACIDQATQPGPNRRQMVRTFMGQVEQTLKAFEEDDDD